MNYLSSKFLAIDFCNLTEEMLLEIFALRNHPEIAKFMYSSAISQRRHFEFVNRLQESLTEKYWAVFEDTQAKEDIYIGSDNSLQEEVLAGYNKPKFLGVGSLSRINFTHKHSYIGIYKNIFDNELAHKGTKILRFLEHIAFEVLGLHALFLEVMQENIQAYEFYKRNAYENRGVLREFVRKEKAFSDVVIMSKITQESMQDFPRSLSIKKTTPFIVAELSANHNGSLEIARDSLKAIAKSGAHAVKLQTYTPECLTLDARNGYFRIRGGLWDNYYLYDLYKQAQMPWEWHKELFQLGSELGLIVFSSPFSIKGVDFLESLGCPMYKIASFEVLDLELIEYVARSRKPMILSSGIANDDELAEAISICKANGVDDITVLHCVSAYPAALDSMNLAYMPRLREKFGVKFGLSDHTRGCLCGSIATSLGASMIEKHFVLDKSLKSLDADFSLDAKEFQEFCKTILDTKTALGDAAAQNIKSGREFGRGVWVCRDIKKGEIFTRENIRVLRPHAPDSLNPRLYKSILGKKAAHSLLFGTPLRSKDIALM